MSRMRMSVAAIGPAVALMGALAIAQAPAQPSPGIYLQTPGKSGDEGRVRLRAVMVTEMKQTGMLKMIATSGLAKGAVVGAISGEHATVRTPAGDIQFTIYLNTGGGSVRPREPR